MQCSPVQEPTVGVPSCAHKRNTCQLELAKDEEALSDLFMEKDCLLTAPLQSSTTLCATRHTLFLKIYLMILTSRSC